MTNLIYWSKLHANALLFAVFYVVHTLNIHSVSGSKYLGYTFIYGAGVLLFYVLGRWTIEAKLSAALSATTRATQRLRGGPLLMTADLAIIAFPIAYFAMAGWVPAWTMLFSDDYYANSGLRHEFYGELPTTLKYAGEYFLRGLAPFWLLYAYITRRPLYLAILTSTSLFALGIVTKSSIVILLAPLLVYQVCKRKFTDASIVVGMMGLVLFANVVLQDKTLIAPTEIASEPIIEQQVENPTVAPSTPTTANTPTTTAPQSTETSAETSAPTASLVERATGLLLGAWKTGEGLTSRIFHVNGLVVTQWMDSYTTEFSFENGCGYGWYAALTRCTFVNVPYKIWLKYYPELDARGLVGSVSAANYVNGYANFGIIGIVTSGIGMGLLLVFLNSAFPSRTLSVAINAAPLALTFESPVSTLMNSGGWGLAILLSIVFLYANSSSDATFGRSRSPRAVARAGSHLMDSRGIPLGSRIWFTMDAG